MQLGYTFPLAATPVTLPAFVEARLILTAATAGAITVSPGPAGSPFVVPAGSGPGVLKLAMGSSAVNTFAVLSNPADAAVASMAIRPWDSSTQLGAANPARGSAVFLEGQQQGTLSARSIVAGNVAIQGALTAPLTLAAPGGWSQVIPAGAAGVVPLTGPTGPGVTWSFANAADCYACPVVVALTPAP